MCVSPIIRSVSLSSWATPRRRLVSYPVFLRFRRLRQLKEQLKKIWSEPTPIANLLSLPPLFLSSFSVFGRSTPYPATAMCPTVSFLQIRFRTLDNWRDLARSPLYWAIGKSRIYERRNPTLQLRTDSTMYSPPYFCNNATASTPYVH
jgi:hypothetical protein